MLGMVQDPAGISRIAHYPTASGLMQALKKTTYPHLQYAELAPVKVRRSSAMGSLLSIT